MLILKNKTFAEDLCNAMAYLKILFSVAYIKQNAFVKTVWPSGLRRWLKAPSTRAWVRTPQLSHGKAMRGCWIRRSMTCFNRKCKSGSTLRSPRAAPP